MRQKKLLLRGVVAAGLSIIAMTLQAENPEVWIIGEFNEWKMPAGAESNGALKLLNSDGENPGDYYVMFYSSEIKPKLVFYYKDPESGKDLYACGPGFPVSLFSTTSERGYASFGAVPVVVNDLEFAKNNPYEVLDAEDNYGQWVSLFCWDSENGVPNMAGLGWTSAPSGNPLTSYSQKLCIESEHGEIKMDYDPLKHYNDVYEFSIAEDCRIHLEVGVNYWSCDQGFTPTLNSCSEKTFHIGSAGVGNPIEINCNAPTKVTVNVDKVLHLMSIETKPEDLNEIDCIYLLGYNNNWAQPSETNASVFKILNRVGHGVYEAVVDFPGVADDSKALFRFKRGLDGIMNNDNLGSALYSGIAPVEFNNDGEYECPIVWNGLGNWQFTDWGLAGKVLIRIDLNSLTMHLTNMDINGLESVDEEECLFKYYNMQGVPVDKPSEGIYIRTNGVKSEKVRL